MADQKRSDYYVVSTIIPCGLLSTVKELNIFAVRGNTNSKSNPETHKDHLDLKCEYEPHSQQTQRIAPQGISVKAT